jgi:hypothetical protein
MEFQISDFRLETSLYGPAHTRCHADGSPVYKAQVLTYMRVTGKPAGLLINFKVPRLMDGVKRLINPACESSTS